MTPAQPPLADVVRDPAALPDAAVPAVLADAAMSPALADAAMSPVDAAASDGALTPPDLAPRISPISVENLRPGEAGWRLSAPSTGMGGFAAHTSYRPGETVAIHAAAELPTLINWELWRLGYYGGTGARRIEGGGPVALPKAAAAVIDPATGMVRAPWAVSFTFALPDDALTGIYLVKLISATAQTYVPVIVREKSPTAPILFPLALATYQAYNAWGGTSLYDNHRRDFEGAHAYAVSFDRPYLQGDGAGQLFYADRHFLTFVEGQGYDIAYCADDDLEEEPLEAGARRFVVLEGHSEYWSAGQRSVVEAALAGGTNLAFLGANDLYWQVRYSDAGRTLTGYKDRADLDPAWQWDPSQVTTLWRNPPLHRPENALLGVQFGEWTWTAVPFFVSAPGAWVWSGADVSTGAMIPGLYGFEIDRRYDNGHEPPGVMELGNGLAESHEGVLAAGQATIYQAPSGAMVFAAGTTDWSLALAAEGRWDARVQQATHNLFARFAGADTVGKPPRLLMLPPGPQPATLRAGVMVSTVTTALTSPTAAAVAPDGAVWVLDGNSLVRVVGGTVNLIGQSFSGPRGIAIASDGTAFVADTGNHVIKRVRSDGTTTTIAGSVAGFADGASAKFYQPMSIACLPSGLLLVADVWNFRVRSVDPKTGVTATWAGDGAAAVKDGPGATASFYFPMAITALPDGSAVVVESGDGLIRKIGNDPLHSVSTYAGQIGRSGWNDGPLSTAQVFETIGVAARPDGSVVLLDGATYRLRLASGGAITTLAGGRTAALVDGAGAEAGFHFPRGAAAAPDGSLYVVDVGNHALRKIAIP